MHTNWSWDSVGQTAWFYRRKKVLIIWNDTTPSVNDDHCAQDLNLWCECASDFKACLWRGAVSCTFETNTCDLVHLLKKRRTGCNTSETRRLSLFALVRGLLMLLHLFVRTIKTNNISAHFSVLLSARADFMHFTVFPQLIRLIWIKCSTFLKTITTKSELSSTNLKCLWQKPVQNLVFFNINKTLPSKTNWWTECSLHSQI